MRLDTVIRNARIHTMDRDRPRARSVGILHGRIVGFDEEIAGLPATRTIDAAGSAVVPGLNDAHCHTTWFGLGLSEINVGDVGALPDLYARLRAGAGSSPASEWIIATGFNHYGFGGEIPAIAELDQLSGGRPLVLKMTSGHALIANTRALELAGIGLPSFVPPVGGVVRRDGDGRPNGVLEETAQDLVLDLVRPYAVETIVAALDAATAIYAREGITSFTEAGIGSGMIGHSPLELAAYQQAVETGRLHARAQVMPTYPSLSSLAGHAADGIGVGLPLGIRSGFGDDRLSFGPVKMFFDGAITAATAAMTEPYTHAPHVHGYLTDDPEVLATRAADAYRLGWSLAIHAIGDAAIDAAIDAIDGARARYGGRRIPSRIEHGALIRPVQLRRIAQAGIAIAPHPSFFATMGDLSIRNIGPEREQYFYRVQSLLRCIESYVTRATGSGAVVGPHERLTGDDALRLYTEGSARATGLDSVKGTLAPGKLADLVLMSDAPADVEPGAIHAIEVRATMVGGEFSFEG